MKRQASFLKLTHERLISSGGKRLKSKRAEKLYQKLLKMSLTNNDRVLPLSYKYLKANIGYEYISIRVALWELEKLSLITKTPARMNGSFYIELNPEFWVSDKKTYMKEKFEDTRTLLGEINDGIGFEHESHCHELMSNILTSLDELEAEIC